MNARLLGVSTRRFPGGRGQRLDASMALLPTVALLSVTFGMFRTAAASGDVTVTEATAQKLQLPSGPASVRGLADRPELALFAGQARYDIPIDLPKGLQGYAPDIRLLYDGSLGNSVVGLGWTLDVPMVRRVTRAGVPGYDNDDTLELAGFGDQGGRLIAIDDSELRVEGQGQRLRVIDLGGSWSVTDSSDGTVLELGSSAASRDGPSGTNDTAVWWLAQARTLAGETAAYSYSGNGGHKYLMSIKWGPEQSLQVSFHYRVRPDPVVSYRTGRPVTVRYRLSAISVWSHRERLRTYLLSYDDNQPLSRLAEVCQTGRGVTSRCEDAAKDSRLPPTTFSYGEISEPRLFEAQNVDGWALQRRGVVFADVNGDGAEDLLRLEGTVSYKQNLGGGRFAAAVELHSDARLQLDRVRLTDLDGDGRPEVLTEGASGRWRSYTVRPTGVVSQHDELMEVETPPLLGYDTLVADVNGDGKADVVRPAGTDLRVYTGDGTGFGLAERIGSTDVDGQRTTPGAPGVRFRDANGDGIVDALIVREDSYRTCLGDGSGRFWAQPWVEYPFATEVDPERLRFADLNRDGLLDLVVTERTHVHWYAGLADGGFVAEPRVVESLLDPHDHAVVTFADVTGNGALEVVWSTVSGMWVAEVATASTAGLLHSVDNGMGGVTHYAYAGSGEMALEAESAGRPWERTMPRAVSVVVEERRETANELPRTTALRAADPFWDTDERRFGGFLRVVSQAVGVDATGTLVTTTQFHAGQGFERVLRGLPHYVRVSDGAGNLFSETHTTWIAATVAGLQTADCEEGAPCTSEGADLLRVARSMQTRRVVHEGSSTQAVETVVQVRYDADANPVQERDWGRMDMLGDEVIRGRRFAHDEERWLRDRVCEEWLMDATGALFARTREYYGDQEAEEPLCVVGRGLVRRVEALRSEPEPKWVEQSRTEYDTWANPVSHTVHGVRRELTYGDDGMFPIRETIAPGSEGALAWEAEWDSVTQQVLWVREPTGTTHRVEYDPVGRRTATAVDGFPPHIRMEYDFDSDTPTVTVRTFDGSFEALAEEAEKADGFPDKTTEHWRTEISVYNGFGEQRYTATWLGELERLWVVAGYRERDERGHTVLSAEPFYAATGEAARDVMLPQTAAISLAAWDALGRPTVRQLPNGMNEVFAYEPFTVTTSRTDLAARVVEKDGQGQPIRASQIAQTGESSSETFSIAFSHDPAGRITQVSQQDGAVVTDYRYNSLGELLEIADPDAGRRVFAYDDHGRLVRRDNDASASVEYGYDALGRVTEALPVDGSAGYAYQYGNADDGYGAGHLVEVSEPEGRVELEYDRLGRSEMAERYVRGERGLVARTYSPSGLELTRTFDGLVEVGRGYDKAARLRSLGSYWEALELDASARPVQEAFGNGVVRRRALDDLGHPTYVNIARSDGTLYEADLRYNAWGGLTDLIDLLVGQGSDHTAHYGYDQLGRLENASIGTAGEIFELEYRYDALHNMVKRTAKGPRVPQGMVAGYYRHGESVGVGPRQLGRVQSVDPSLEGAEATGATDNHSQLLAMAYDSAGRTILEGDKTFAYDAFDHLKSVTLGDSDVVAHAYSYDNYRTLTEGPIRGTVRRFFDDSVRWDDGRRSYYIKHGEDLLARVDTDSDGTTVEALYFHSATTTSPLLVTDASGALLDERRYEPFGGVIEADHELESWGAGNRPYEPETGLVDHQFRWRSTGSARMLTPDQYYLGKPEACIESPIECNVYTYARNSPVLYVDPTGESAKDALIGYSIGFFNGIRMALNGLNPRDCHDNAMARAEFKPEPGVWSDNAADDAHFRTGVELGKIVGSWGTILAGGARSRSPATPKTAPNLLGNAEVRAWYNSAVKGLDTSGPLTRATGSRVHTARNALKQQARDMMADRGAAAKLARDRPLQNMDYYIEKYSAQGYKGEALWKRIIEGGTTPNAGVNARYGVGQ